ncbi:MAG TPA: hypothetical protein PLU53_13640 [Bacteroidia bacterium]|nr:hypothetical protein [Bacteroidia bacterium]
MNNKQNNTDRHEELSPLLESLKNQHGFRVPEAYFEELPGIIQSQISQLPDFDKTTAVNPFSVPDGYFEQLPMAISNAIGQTYNSGFKLRSVLAFFHQPKLGLAFTSVALVVFISVRFFTREIIVSAPKTEFTLEDLNQSSSLDGLDETLLIDLLAEQIQENPADSETNNIEQYLIDNDIDIAQLESIL